jgi:hypothetical protein
MNEPKTKQRIMTAKELREAAQSFNDKVLKSDRREGDPIHPGAQLLFLMVFAMLEGAAEAVEHHETEAKKRPEASTPMAEVTPWDHFMAAALASNHTTTEAAKIADDACEERGYRAKKGAL